MLIASLVVVAVFIIFITVTFFVTRKNISFEVDGNKLRILNAGSSLKIFLNDSLYSFHHMPQLIKGEEFFVKINEQELKLVCKSNSFGNKLHVKAFINDNEVFDNLKKIKTFKNQKEF